MTKFFMIAAMALTLATTAHAQAGAASGQQPQLTETTSSDMARHEVTATAPAHETKSDRAALLDAARNWTQAALDCDCATSVLSGVSTQAVQSGH